MAQYVDPAFKPQHHKKSKEFSKIEEDMSMNKCLNEFKENTNDS
jgi:hypothetical protein